MQPHIIRRQALNVRCAGGGNADGVRLQRETEQLYRTQILPGLERLLDKYGPGDEIISIDKLAISLSDIKPDSINNALAQRILDEVERQLQQTIQKTVTANEGRLTAEEHFLQCWVHYLQHGYFPWWADIKDNNTWQERLKAFVEKASGRLLQALKQSLVNKNVVARLSVQLDNGLFWPFFKQLTGWQDTLLRSLQADEQQVADTLAGSIPQTRFRQKFHELLLSVCHLAYTQHLLTGFFAGKIVGYLHDMAPEGLYALKYTPLETEELKEAVKDHAGSIDDMPGMPVSESMEETMLNNEEGIYINNAGMVLIAPYLPVFFSRLDLVKDQQVTDLQRAVGVLQYVVTGKEDYAEFEMVLPKILCGAAPETAVADGYRLTEEEKELADGMLTAVIGHWTVLKNTSVDGLRGTFLQREGKLTYTNDAWKLQVQEQAFDMLLDQLPWSFSMIRLPWMQYLLHVIWR